MAFRIEWICEECGNSIWSNTEPEETECSCYEEPYVEKNPIFIPMDKKEEKARYRQQYMLNGYTWGNKHPWMYMGPFKTYINREVKINN